jgi:hypothetical protein
LTVAELIQQLQKLPQDHRIFYVGGLAPYIEISGAGTDRIREPKMNFGQVVPVTGLRPSPPEIEVVILQ